MINVTRVPYKLKQVTGNVFLVTFKTAYDVAMTFCRVQEFQESPKHKGKLIRMADFTRDYALSKKGTFTYPSDWRGFNVPSTALHEVYDRLSEYDETNDYDQLMYNIMQDVWEYIGNEAYYLIGTSQEKGDKEVVKHETAHGLYNVSPLYQASVKNLIKHMNPSAKAKMYKALKKLEYHKSVWDDELNAYLSTGLHACMDTKVVRGSRKPFIKLLEETA